MKSFKSLYLIAFASSILVVGCSSDSPKTKTSSKLMENEARVNDIISQMTLEEKVEMLHGKHMFTSAGVERLGIADMAYADGPFGIREELEPNSWNPLGLTTDSATFFPTGSALAATWSEEISYEYGVGMAREARLRGKDMLLGPAMNIQRFPTGGRTYEYFSEDPILSAALSVGYTKGVQDNGVAVCLKHYALNSQENNRGRVDVIVSPRTMREIYLPPFEAAVKEADAYGVMAAYNKVAGYWCSENNLLMNVILRDEWGFKGLVISDWGGTHSTVNAALYGLDVEMPGSRFFGQALLDSVQAGIVPEAVIDAKVRNILRVRLAIDPIPENEANKVMTAQPEQARIAYNIATKSIVLLKNETSLLPLDFSKHKKIAVIGDNAIRTQASGGVGAGVKALKEITPLEGLKAKIGNKAEIIFAQGYEGFAGFRGRRDRNAPIITPYTEANAELLKEAVKVAEEADIVLFIAGNNREVETEGSDRIAITLPSGQDEIIEALAAVNPNIVTVIVAGAPVDLNVVQPLSPSILVSWFNGSEGGNALADVLVGNIAPSGKLPFTFPVRLEDSPAYALKNYPQTDDAIEQDIFVELVQNTGEKVTEKITPNRNIAIYSEESLVGYRWFDTKNVAPMYSFGHGLSYVNFVYDGLLTNKEKYGKNETIQVSFKLTNSGNMEADEVVQLYVHRIGSTIEWPLKELKAFQRVSLNAGETKTVNLSIPVSKLRYWDEEKYDWVLENGEIELIVGSSSSDLRLRKNVQI